MEETGRPEPPELPLQDMWAPAGVVGPWSDLAEIGDGRPPTNLPATPGVHLVTYRAESGYWRASLTPATFSEPRAWKACSGRMPVGWRASWSEPEQPTTLFTSPNHDGQSLGARTQPVSGWLSGWPTGRLRQHTDVQHTPRANPDGGVWWVLAGKSRRQGSRRSPARACHSLGKPHPSGLFDHGPWPSDCE
jgi:hypothetical protein